MSFPADCAQCGVDVSTNSPPGDGDEVFCATCTRLIDLEYASGQLELRAETAEHDLSAARVEAARYREALERVHAGRDCDLVAHEDAPPRCRACIARIALSSPPSAARAEIDALRALERTVRSLMEYERDGGPDFCDWDSYYESARRALAAIDDLRGKR